MSMHPDLKWLAQNVTKWPGGLDNKMFSEGGILWDHTAFGNFHEVETIDGFNFAQWVAARNDLGLIEDLSYTPMTPEEEALPAKEHRNKYMREIKPGVWVDCYDVLKAWAVTNPGLQHLIKKALAPGHRGHKTLDQDMNDIVASAERARELEK